jgi:hypothetical protein
LNKEHGLKYVPPPKHENLQALREEEKFFSTAYPDYLLGDKFKDKTKSCRTVRLSTETSGNKKKDWISMMSNQSGAKAIPAFTRRGSLRASVAMPRNENIISNKTLKTNRGSDV